MRRGFGMLAVMLALGSLGQQDAPRTSRPSREPPPPPRPKAAVPTPPARVSREIAKQRRVDGPEFKSMVELEADALIAMHRSGASITTSPPRPRMPRIEDTELRREKKRKRKRKKKNRGW